MISRIFECIYIHQRKTAGTSIIQSFGLTPKDPDWHLYNDGVLSSDYGAMSEAESWFFKFTTVRNPFDRLVSAWKYLPATQNLPLEAVLRNPPREGHDYRHFTRPQAATVTDESGALIVDFVIRFEDLQHGYDQVCDLINKPRQVLPATNATQRDRDYRRYFTPASRALAESLVKDDLIAFGYEF